MNQTLFYFSEALLLYPRKKFDIIFAGLIMDFYTLKNDNQPSLCIFSTPCFYLLPKLRLIELFCVQVNRVPRLLGKI